MERYICIHGHFYHPPRENPWLEAIELQDSAYPYHDWNERITAECYAPNAAARILGAGDRIERIVNNYSRISFNLGPTLLVWLSSKAPEVYRAILDADSQSRERFSGHGSALAQPYNHMILPLANRRDKYTQVLWGIGDFEHRFGRKPEGMWLPETAVDLETLAILADMGIEFTLLAPWQADRDDVDPTEPYRVALPEGRSISVFFYHQGLSGRVSFDPSLTTNADAFALHDLPAQYHPEKLRRGEPHLLLVATDGRSEEHTSELQSRGHLVCRLLLEKSKRVFGCRYWTHIEVLVGIVAASMCNP